MKRTFLIAFIACLSLALMFVIGCSPEDSQDAYRETSAQQQEATPCEEEVKAQRLERFVYEENQIFAGMDGDFYGAVSSDGTTLRYSYTFCLESINIDAMPAVFENMASEGSVLLISAQSRVPEITAVVIEFLDTEGNVLESKEFN